MSKRFFPTVSLLVVTGIFRLAASDYLFYLEAQAVAGYSTAAKKIVFSSLGPMEVMQKPSLGFDWVKRFSSTSRDIAILAVQFRLAMGESEKGYGLEPQLYNAYLKFKTQPADFWVGHNRIPFGLAASLDSHAELLQPLAMSGYGFDRDWGIGMQRDFAWGNAAVSLSTGSGMPLHFKGNHLLAGRLSLGVLERDNRSFGFSFGYGKTLDVMGYHLLADRPTPFRMAAFDLTWLRDNWENRLEFVAGNRLGNGALAVLWRTGLGFLSENRMKIELQSSVVRENGKTGYLVAAAATYLATADLTLRTMVFHDWRSGDSRVVFQVYYYKGIRF